MAATKGGLSVGDVVLSFLADTTNLDAALARIQADTAAKLKPSGDAVAALGKAFTDTGVAASQAGTQISNSAQIPAQQIKKLQDELALLRQQLQLTGSQSGTAFGSSGEAIAQLKTQIVSVESALEALNVKIQETGHDLSSAGTGSKLPLLTAEVKEVGASLQVVGQDATVAGAEISSGISEPLQRMNVLRGEITLLRQQLQQTGAESGAAFSSGSGTIAQLQVRIAELEAELTALNLKVGETAVAFSQMGKGSQLPVLGADAAALGKGFNDVAKSATIAGQSASAAGHQVTEAQKPVIDALKAEDGALRVVAQEFQTAGKAASGVGPAAKAGLGSAGQDVATLQAKVAELEAELKDTSIQFQQVGSKARAGLREATAEVGLISEATISLPRHVRSFIASLSGVNELLVAAFDATAVLFIIDAIIRAGEKLDEFNDKPRLIEEAWRSVGDSTAAASREMRTSLDDAEAKIVGLTNGPLAEMDYKILHLGTSAQKVSGLIGKMGDDLVKALALQDTTKFDILSHFLDNSRDVTKQATIFFQDLQSVINQSGNQAGLVALSSQIQTVDLQIEKTTKDLEAQRALFGTFGDVGKGFEAAAAITERLLDAQNRYKASLLDTINVVRQGQELDLKDKNVELLNKRREAGVLLAEQAKRDLDTQISLIQQKEAVQHAAFVSGDADAASFRVAQINAIDATTAAHEKYLARLVTIYKNSGDVVKAQAIAQELATAKTVDAAKQLETLSAATEKYHAATLKIVKDWENLQNAAVVKDFDAAQKAVERLTIEEIKLADAQRKLQEAGVKADFSAQETAIQNLAAFGIISEQQKADRLRVLYQQEENDALSALRDQLAKEKTAVDAAQSKFDAAKANPTLTDAQVTETQINLDRLKIAYDHTQTEIVNSTASYEAKRIALQRGAAAEAIALAVSEGKQQLAADIEYKQSSLDIINALIRAKKAGDDNTKTLEAMAKARGIDTNNLKAEQKETEKQTKDLEHQASKGKETQQAITEWSKAGQQAARDFGAAMFTAMAAVVQGQIGFGKAMEGVILDVISKLAQHWADYYFALAIGAWGDPAAEAAYIAAGVALEAVAGAISGAAGLITSKGAASTTASNPTTATTSPATTPTQQPVQVVNIAHLARGGVVDKRQPFMLGDSASGGDAAEGVIPLDDDRATGRIAAAIAKPLQLHTGLLSRTTLQAIGSTPVANGNQGAPGGSAEYERRLNDMTEAIERIGGQSGGTVFNVHVDGVISPDNLRKVFKQASQGVSRGTVRFTAGNSYRITRRG